MALEPLSGGIGVVGTGVIGASWAAYFLAKGFDVAATDPAEEQRNVCGHWSVSCRRSSTSASPRAPREAGCAFTPISRAPTT